MPIIKSAKKAARQAVKRKSKNEAIKKTIRSALKAFRLKPDAKKMAIVQSEYDKAVKKGLLKKNTASRRKAKLVKIAKENGVKLTATTKAKATAKAPVKTATKKTAPKKNATAKKTVAKKTTTTKKASSAKKPAAKKTEK